MLLYTYVSSLTSPAKTTVSCANLNSEILSKNSALLRKHRENYLHFRWIRKNNCASRCERGFEIGERALFGAGKRHSVTLPRASRVTRSALPVRSQRASKSGSGASRRAEQKSSAYRSSDNEATSTMHTKHTHICAHVSRACHVYYRLRRGIARVRFLFTPCFLVSSSQKWETAKCAIVLERSFPRSDDTTVSPCFTAIRIHVYARASRSPAIRDTHTYTHRYMHAHKPRTLCNTHIATSALFVRAWFATRA